MRTRTKTAQDASHHSAYEYKSLFGGEPGYWIILGKGNLNCHEKINLRYNLIARACPTTDQLLIRFDRRDI